MSLAPGSRLGPYEIVAPLGAGGMGEVYRARDTRLGRDVAVKVLPRHLSAHPEVRSRFEREARAVAALNHPHICVLHDVGREGDTDYLVMELVEGETLAARLARGPLPVAEALKVGAQVAEALDRAHRAGVIHRDLKPGNVMLAKSGAKLMDFGLARATGMAGAAPGSGLTAAALTQSPTMAQPLTAEGTIIGTFQYMAPEQLEGREADARSDIWALGCVLYEMVAGRRAFEGRSQASLITAIMGSEPPALAQAAPLAPAALDRIVRRCLAKDPDDRYQSTGDLSFALRETGLGAPSGVTEAPAARGAAPARANAGFARGVLVGVAAVAVVGAVLALALGGGLARKLGLGGGAGTRDAAIPRTFDVVLPDSLPFDFLGDAPLSTEQRALALSPDGARLVYVTRTSAGTMLAAHDLRTGETRALAGTEGGFSPTFSPDGGSIAFLSGNDLKRMSLDGGGAQTLATVDEPWGGTWVDAARIFVAGRQGLDAAFIDASSGAVDSIPAGPRQVGSVTPDGGGMFYSSLHVVRYFDFRTRKDWFLTARGRVPAGPVVPPDALQGFGPSLLPSGELLYVQPGGAGTLAALPLDAKTLRPTGNAIPIASNLRYVTQGASQYVVSRDGVAIMAITPGSGRLEFVTYSGAGTPEPLALPPADYGTFEISPDGSRIAMVVWPVNGPPDIVVYDVARRTSERLVRGTALSPQPFWSPDGQSVLFTASGTADAPFAFLRVPASGGGAAETLSSGRKRGLGISSDGRRLLRSDFSTAAEVVAMDSLGSPGTTLPGLNTLASFSPDGAWLAATSTAGNRSEVYVLPLARPSERYRVSAAGGEEPRWSRDGRKLVFRYGPAWFESTFEPGRPPLVGMPRPLFEGPFVNVPGYSHAMFPDGRHLMLRGARESQARRLTAITELPRLLEDAAKRR